MSDTLHATETAGAATREGAGLREDKGLNTPAASGLQTSFRLTVTGEPVAKARPRATTIGGHARLYTPSTTRRYEDRVRETALRDWRHDPLRGVAIRLVVVFTLPVPVSWPNWKREDALAGSIVPTGKPDLDNLVKSIQDGLNGTIYADDAMIADKNASKRYGDNPRADLLLTWRPMRERK